MQKKYAPSLDLQLLRCVYPALPDDPPGLRRGEPDLLLQHVLDHVPDLRVGVLSQGADLYLLGLIFVELITEQGAAPVA